VLIRQSTAPGELVIDPFMGSGSVGVAATGLGRRFGGSDLAQASIEMARARLLAGGAVEADVMTLRADEPQVQRDLFAHHPGEAP
jgi:DNA modification methylase